MMALSMYSALVPVAQTILNNLSNILKKAEAHAAAKNIDPDVLLTARLFPDMFALTRQVQITTDVLKGGVARLAAVDIPIFEDTEKTFDELYARIAKTLVFIETVPAVQFEGSEARDILFFLGKNKEYRLEFNGHDYLVHWILPNAYFHMTTAYNILRHNGVELGKQDFLGTHA